MTAPDIRAVHFGGRPGAPTLVVGPSLGTSVSALWSTAATLLTDTYRVVGWDLPGHGTSPAPTAAFSIAELADAAVALIDLDGPVVYAGVSVAGAVGLELVLHHRELITAAALICTGARIGEPAAWRERARIVRSDGTSAMLASAADRWFAPGFTDREPHRATALLQSLEATDAEGYALTCDALARFDVGDQLAGISTPVLAVAGDQDVATPPASLRHLAAHIRRASYLELPDTGHLAAAERPERIADAVRSLHERVHP